jgi:hypothetical protein
MLSSIKQCVSFCVHTLQEHVLRWIEPPTISFVLDMLVDLTKGKAELLAENALLRQQLIILHRQDGSDLERGDLSCPARDEARASIVSSSACSPKRKSKVCARKPRLSPETIALIKEMATNNRLWGAERIRGELLKFNQARPHQGLEQQIPDPLHVFYFSS